ncbi:hypothetical protein [Dysgonomonas macrotermitis]|uniref:Uncharacterized protein n=1 Tax=Dysgonomonas macrotermitis TaxID=1346286 RepID=A0A1M4WDC1_9BACT|nr:hypothetical protein [Dysgonomonas macrotermitis]SHE79150.1 hypothetical protein SAMN05444362_102196 [Dysgonomonas macrotermitis]
MKDFFKVALLTVIVSIIFIGISIAVPYSQSFREISGDSGLTGIATLLILNLFCCYTIFYVIRNSTLSGIKTIICLSISLPCVYIFMTQIETLFFISAFPALTKMDVLLIMFSNSVPLVIGILIGNKIFARKEKIINYEIESKTLFSKKGLIAKIFIIGFLYAIIYFLFGYFVAWQSEDLRIFYSGSPLKDSFIEKLISNFKEDPFIYLFQIVRGILFALFISPIVFLFSNKSKTLLVSIILIYATTALCLIIPNKLFPDSVRWAHFIEMSTSMLLFAFVTWFVYNKISIKTNNG